MVVVKGKVCDPSSVSHRKLILDSDSLFLLKDPYFHYKPNTSFSRRELLKSSIVVDEVDNGKQIQQAYQVQKLLGRGAFGRVYLAEGHNHNKSRLFLLALKAEIIDIPWEYYALKKVHKYLDDSQAHAVQIHQQKQLPGLIKDVSHIELARMCVIYPQSQILYSDESHLLLEYAGNVTLMDALNSLNSLRSYRATGIIDKAKISTNTSYQSSLEVFGGDSQGGLGEILSLYIAIQLINCVQQIHKAGILHCDIKPDNVMIQIKELSNSLFAGKLDLGIKLIDFGRAVVIDAYEPDSVFLATWKSDSTDCLAIRKQMAWKYSIDYHGIASVIHAAVFGKYISTVNRRGFRKGYRGYKQHVKEEIIEITKSIKRSWNQDLWHKIFEMLLNPWFFYPTAKSISSVGQVDEPIYDQLDSLVCEMERYLVAIVETSAEGSGTIEDSYEIQDIKRTIIEEQQMSTKIPRHVDFFSDQAQAIGGPLNQIVADLVREGAWDVATLFKSNWLQTGIRKLKIVLRL